MACYGKGLEARQYEIQLSSKSTQGERGQEDPTDCSQYAPIYIFGCLCAACFYGQPHFLCSTTLAANVTLEGILTVRSATGL